MNFLYGLWDDFLSLLFPRLCPGCGCHLLRNENVICTECYVLMPRTNFHLDGDNPVSMLFWGRCRLEKAAAFSFYSRGSRIRNMIHDLKYRGNTAVGTELGRIYGLALLRSGFLDGIDLIVPVPLHPSKKRLRGFNQSELIAGGISEASGIPVSTGILRRTSASATQTKKTRYERWTNVEGIFALPAEGLSEGKHLLLVDDVITTGATIEACAATLLKNGDIKVSAVALAYAAT